MVNFAAIEERSMPPKKAGNSKKYWLFVHICGKVCGDSLKFSHTLPLGDLMDTKIVMKTFRSRKVLTLEKLTSLLGHSIRTTRRFLKQQNALTSINRNARFYTLPDLPKFDSNGIWQYRGIFFSLHGNLRQTILQLILRSDAGLTANEIIRMVGLSGNSPFVSTFKDVEAITREEHRSGYIYFAQNAKIYKRQKNKRMTLSTTPGPLTSLPSDADAVVILVELIKHPNWSPAQLSESLRHKGTGIDRDSIERLLVHYDLKKKAKPPVRRF
jgi:hypothetical protein